MYLDSGTTIIQYQLYIRILLQEGHILSVKPIYKKKKTPLDYLLDS